MSNLLTPPGLVSKSLYDHRSKRKCPDGRTDPMPCYIGAWITTEKGIRRLMPKETSKGLGAPKTERIVLTSSLLRSSTSLFHWEYVSSSLTLPSLVDGEFKDAEPLKSNQWPEPSDEEGDTDGLPRRIICADKLWFLGQKWNEANSRHDTFCVKACAQVFPGLIRRAARVQLGSTGSFCGRRMVLGEDILSERSGLQSPGP
jgi:hypothetical protein